MGKLYIVATPIGNLEDITLRAIRVLKEVSLVAAEDTRKARLLFDRHAIGTPTTSYADHNKLQKLPLIMERLETGDVALISEAGMPGLNDPAYELVQACIQKGIPVTVIPGPSVVPAALVLSGLPIEQFTYAGYLPRRSSGRRTMLKGFAGEKRTLLLLEAPHRLKESLQDMLDVFGDRRIAVCRELTKLYEEVFRGTISEALAHFQEPRGEFTMVVAGAAEKPHGVSTSEAKAHMQTLMAGGATTKDAAQSAAKVFGLSRRQAYQLLLEIKASDSPSPH